MAKNPIRKLKLTRETLRSLSMQDMSRVVGGTLGETDDPQGCAATWESACYLCQQSATCGCNGPSAGTGWCTGAGCNESGVCTANPACGTYTCANC
jgi:natural product precursor